MFVGGTLIAMLPIGSVGAVVVDAQEALPHLLRLIGPGQATVCTEHISPGPNLRACQCTRHDFGRSYGRVKSGKTLSQIATEKGVNLETVLAAIQAARKADFTTQISQAVLPER